MTLLSTLLVASLALPCLPEVHAQSQPNPQSQPNAQSQNSIDQDVDLLRKDVRSQKKQIIAANLKLSDAEAEKFWPIYDQYTADLVKINDAKYGAIKEYAQNYDTMTDDRATALTKQIIGVDEAVAQLRERYVPIVNKVLPGKKTALFFQLDRRLVMLIDVQLATQIPMVQP
jgi:Zn-dependent M32 family carboxypeptidase